MRKGREIRGPNLETRFPHGLWEKGGGNLNVMLFPPSSKFDVKHRMCATFLFFEEVM